MDKNDVKYRHELKYIISQGQMMILKQRLSGLLPIDVNTGENGYYNISSLYFDDYYNSNFYDNLNGTDPREKIRIRIYNHSDNRISLECKRKERGKTLKTSCKISKEQCNLLMGGKTIEEVSSLSPVMNKLQIKMKTRAMKPVIIVEYDRIPYVYKDGNVRITLDMNISSSNKLTDFLEESVPKRPVMPNGLQLLEVKYDEFLPDVFYRALQLENLNQTAYSKYYLCRKYSL